MLILKVIKELTMNKALLFAYIINIAISFLQVKCRIRFFIFFL